MYINKLTIKYIVGAGIEKQPTKCSNIAATMFF